MSITSNINPLSPNGFQLTIQKLPDLIYFSQTVNLPGIQLPHITFDNMFVAIPISGTNIQFDTLDVEFLVDENMNNYLMIYNWMIAMGYPQNFDQYINFQNSDIRGLVSDLAKNYSDGTLQILGSNNTVIKSVTFVDLLPTSLSTISFSSTNLDVSYITATVSFQFTYFTFS